MKPIYLDYHATTPVDPVVLEAMLPYFTERFGNAGSGHMFGWVADKAVELARGQVAEAIGAQPREVTFTSGATEALNLAIKGALAAYTSRGKHVVTVATEHKAVLDTCRVEEAAGRAEVTVLTPGRDGVLDLDALSAAIRDDTVLVAVMAANNEIGVLQDVGAIGALCHTRGVLYLCDAVQAVGKVDLDVERDQIDLLAVSGHKLYGPKGVGALYLRKRNPRVRVIAQQHGGGQERGVRSGTLDVPGIVGLGKACALAVSLRATEAERLRGLRDRLWERLQALYPAAKLNGHPTQRLAHNLSVCLPGIPTDRVMTLVRDVAVSAGSACSAASMEPSHVLRAIGLCDDDASSTLRFGLGRFTTDDEIERAAVAFGEAAAQLAPQA